MPGFRGSRRVRLLKATAACAALAVAAAVSIFPVVWAFLTSLKRERDVSVFPPTVLPDPVTLEHYREVAAPIGRYMLNSALVAGITIAVTLVVAAHGAYAASRGDFRFKRPILFVILASMMIPGVAVLIPLYWMASGLGLFNTYTVLIVIYTAWMVPMALWFLRGFFETVPRDLEDAALMDGCSRLGVLYRVAAPLVLPGFSAVAIVIFIFVWNEFIIALSMTTSEAKRVVTVGVYYYITAYGIEWGKLMAAVSLALAPVLIGFFILQRGFIRGMTAGATRG